MRRFLRHMGRISIWEGNCEKWCAITKLEYHMVWLHSDRPTREMIWNKTNLRDLITATGLVILLKLDSNHRLISLCDLKIWWMTSKNNKAPLIYYIKLCASFQIHWWIQTGVSVWKRSIQESWGVKSCLVQNNPHESQGKFLPFHCEATRMRPHRTVIKAIPHPPALRVCNLSWYIVVLRVFFIYPNFRT